MAGVRTGVHVFAICVKTEIISKMRNTLLFHVSVPNIYGTIAVSPGPGGRYRNMNTTFQRSNERAPEYELPPIHTLATTIEKNISNMSTQSSPGFF